MSAPQFNTKHRVRRPRIADSGIVAARGLLMAGDTADALVRHGVVDEAVSSTQQPFSIEALAAKVRETLATSSSTRSGENGCVSK